MSKCIKYFIKCLINIEEILRLIEKDGSRIKSLTKTLEEYNHHLMRMYVRFKTRFGLLKLDNTPVPEIEEKSLRLTKELDLIINILKDNMKQEAMEKISEIQSNKEIENIINLIKRFKNFENFKA